MKLRMIGCALLMAATAACQRGAATEVAAATAGAEPRARGDAIAPAPEVEAYGPGPGMVRVEVADLLSRGLGGAVVLLRERPGGTRVVPMIIGDAEANAIALRLGRRRFERPLTHDLIESVLAEYGIRVIRLEIDALESGVFLGRLFLRDGSGRVKRIDSRPSDGIALAIGAEAPIFMAQRIIDEAGEPAAEWTTGGAAPGAEPAPTTEQPDGALESI